MIDHQIPSGHENDRTETRGITEHGGEIVLSETGRSEERRRIEEEQIGDQDQQRAIVQQPTIATAMQGIAMVNEKMPFNRCPSEKNIIGIAARIGGETPKTAGNDRPRPNWTGEKQIDRERNMNEIEFQAGKENGDDHMIVQLLAKILVHE